MEFGVSNIRSTKIIIFMDLEAWKESHKLVLIIYKLVKSFPSIENFGLVSQMQRAAVSITSNIAEGFGRYSYQEKQRFYFIAKGSLIELQNQLIIARDVNYCSDEAFDKIFNQSIVAQKVINGLIRSNKKYILNS